MNHVLYVATVLIIYGHSVDYRAGQIIGLLLLGFSVMALIRKDVLDGPLNQR